MNCEPNTQAPSGSSGRSTKSRRCGQVIIEIDPQDVSSNSNNNSSQINWLIVQPKYIYIVNRFLYSYCYLSLSPLMTLIIIGLSNEAIITKIKIKIKQFLHCLPFRFTPSALLLLLSSRCTPSLKHFSTAARKNLYFPLRSVSASVLPKLFNDSSPI